MYGECHAHFFLNGHDYQAAVELHKNKIQKEPIYAWFREYQKRGVTFIRDGGDAFGVSLAAKKIAPEYGIDYRTPGFAIYKKGHYGGIVGLGFCDWKEYHGLVRKVRSHNGDFVKIMVSGIMDFNQYGRITGACLQEDEIREMIHIAHEEGFSVMVHANGSEAVRSAVLAGADSIEHGNYMDRDCIQALADSRAVWVPTLATVHNLLGCGRYADPIVEKIYQNGLEKVSYAYGRGAKLALGSDAGAYRVLHGEGIVDEYRCFQEAAGRDTALDQWLRKGERLIEEYFAR